MRPAVPRYFGVELIIYYWAHNTALTAQNFLNSAGAKRVEGSCHLNFLFLPPLRRNLFPSFSSSLHHSSFPSSILGQHLNIHLSVVNSIPTFNPNKQIKMGKVKESKGSKKAAAPSPVKNAAVTKPAQTPKAKTKASAQKVATKAVSKKSKKQESSSESDSESAEDSDDSASSASDSDDSASDSDSEEEKTTKKATPKTNGATKAKAQAKDESSDSSDDDSESDSDEEKEVKAPAPKKAVKAAKAAKESVSFYTSSTAVSRLNS